MSEGSRCRPAFSLVEALVVIMVVVILIGLVSAGLRGARAAAQRTACFANLRELGVALTLYRDTNSGLLPLATELVSLPAGWIAPLDALGEHLTVAIPRLDADGMVVTQPPFHCRADRGYAPEHGFSYAYVPATFMQMIVGADPQRYVSAMYEKAPHQPVLRDARRFHATRLIHDGAGPATFEGCNALRFDGGVVRAETIPPP